MDLGPPFGRSVFDRPYLLLTLTALFWGINVVLGRYIAGTIPPLTLGQIRWTGASLIILPLAWSRLREDWPVIRQHLGILLILSLTGITLYNTMAYVGLHYTQAINGLLMLSGGPLIVAFLSLVLFGDRLTAAQAVGIVISLVGVLAIIARGQLQTLASLALNPGDLWFLAGIWIYAVYTVLLRKRPAIHTISFLAFLIVAGAVMHIPLFLFEIVQGKHMHATPAALAVIAYIIVLPSVVAYLFFNRGVELIGANRAGQFFHLIPVFGSALAILFLGEQPKWYHGAGYALIIFGIWVAQRQRPSADATGSLPSAGGR